MRKFVLLLLFLCTFLLPIVADPQQIQINVIIPAQAPIFLMKASFSADVDFSIGPLNSDKDISIEDIDVYVKLYQTNRARIKGTYQLTVTAEPLYLDAENETLSPSITQISKFASNADITVTGDAAIITINYVKGKPFQPYFGLSNAGEIATFKVTWAAKDDLAPGTYTSYITLTSTSL